MDNLFTDKELNDSINEMYDTSDYDDIAYLIK